MGAGKVEKEQKADEYHTSYYPYYDRYTYSALRCVSGHNFFQNER